MRTTRDFDGLKISPNIPKDWNAVTVERNYRGSKLLISIKNGGDSFGGGLIYSLLNGKSK